MEANQKITSQDYVESYLDKVLDSAGSKVLSVEQRKVIKYELLAEIEKRLRVVSMVSLDEPDLQEYAELINKGETSLNEQIKFFLSHIPHYEALMQATLAEVADEFVHNSQAA